MHSIHPPGGLAGLIASATDGHVSSMSFVNNDLGGAGGHVALA